MTASWRHAMAVACMSLAIVAGTATYSVAQVMTLPGTVQSENFDEGGPGVAYADTTPGNSGGQYRQTDVDIEATTDIGGGYNLGWVFPGEWLKYSVNVNTAGAYIFEFRVASPRSGGTFHLEANGVDVTGAVSIPATGGWQTWATVTKSDVNLGAGPQVLTLVFHNNGSEDAIGNFNYMQVTAAAGGADVAAPFGGTPVALPGTIQAEDFNTGSEGIAYHDLSPANEGGQYRITAVDVEQLRDPAGGYNVGWVFAGEWLNYAVNVNSTGTYDLEFRVASEGGGGTWHLEIDGVDRTGPLTIPDTGGWQTWTTIRRTGVSLSAGQQNWRLVMDANGASSAVGNLDYMRVLDSVGAPVSGGGGDIVLYASDVTTVAGNWTRAGSSSAADAESMQSSDLGWASASQPMPEPIHYFEAGFVPETNRAYRVWLRLRAAGDSKYNDSVWLQFSGAVDAGGAALWRSGTPSGLLVNLEGCNGCGVSSWGWRNGAWWLADDAIVRFPSSSAQTVRVQTREDGVEIDQIVLSPATYFDAAPGSGTNDDTIVPKTTPPDGPPPPNEPPAVALAEPASEATFTAPATITITASASDTDGSVTRVDFYAGTQLVGAATATPWTATWSDVAAGTYSLTAVATDNGGATSTSAAVNVTVNAPPNQPPAASITSPADGATFTAPATITIAASATDSDGSVTRVDFYAGAQAIGTATASPWSVTWSNVAAGTYSVTAIAHDDTGATTTSAAVNVTVNAPPNQPPAASITSPASGATFTAPAIITIEAFVSDSDGNVTRVDFYAGAQAIGTATAYPWSVTWSNVAAGAYSVTAIATDNTDATTTSAAVSVTVNVAHPPPPPGSTTLAFSPSPDHDGAVTSYSVAIYREGDPTSVPPLVTQDLGKPAPANGDITADISEIVNALAAGSYYAVVTTHGVGGAAESTPSAAFTK